MPIPSSTKVNLPRLLSQILWPLAVMTVLHRVVIMSVNGSFTNDFGTVYSATRRFVEGLPVYGENLLTVDPHYLYAPSAHLLMAPFAIIDDYFVARLVFIVLNAGAVLVGLWLLLRLFDLDVRSFAAPALIFGVFSTEAVTHTLVFTNINGIIFLAMMAYLYFLHTRKLWSAGIAMGLSLAIKPMLAPLLFLPFVRKQWQPFIPALSIPAVALALGWYLTVDAAEYVNRTLPYMNEVRDYYNSSIAGLGLYYGAPEPLVLVLRITIIIATFVAVWLLFEYRHTDDVLWLTTTSGVIMTGVFLVSTLGQMYYSMMLFPLVFSVVRSGSVMRNWPAWLAVYGCFTLDTWESDRWPVYGRFLEYTHSTFGWLLLLGTILVVLAWRRADPDRHARIIPRAGSGV